VSPHGATPHPATATPGKSHKEESARTCVEKSTPLSATTRDTGRNIGVDRRGVSHRIRPGGTGQGSFAFERRGSPSRSPRAYARLPRPTLDRGNPQLPRAVKTNIRPLGVLQIPRPGVTVPVHLNTVLGWQPTVWHPRGRKAHHIGGDGRN
jgi:hypothetical protein